MPSAATLCNRAIRYCRSDWAYALELAHEVNDPQFRSGALAWIARFAPREHVVSIAKEALLLAADCDDAYHKTTASALPIRAVIERAETRVVQDMLHRPLETAEHIAHPVRRLSALDLLWNAVFPAGISIRARAQEALIRACLDAKSWRASFTMGEMALIILADDPDESRRIVALMLKSKYQRQAERRLAEGKSVPPRLFFWDVHQKKARH